MPKYSVRKVKTACTTLCLVSLRTWSMVTLPTILRLGSPEPLSTPAAFLSSTASSTGRGRGEVRSRGSWHGMPVKLLARSAARWAAGPRRHGCLPPPGAPKLAAVSGRHASQSRRRREARPAHGRQSQLGKRGSPNRHSQRGLPAGVSSDTREHAAWLARHGSALAVPLAVACVIAYLFSGHRGIYVTQRIHAAKGSALVEGRPRLDQWFGDRRDDRDA